MPESVIGQHAAIANLKNGNSGDLQLKNGLLWLTGAATYTTIGTQTFSPEAVKGNDGAPLRKAKNATTLTANLYLTNGKIYATGHGQVTLID